MFSKFLFTFFTFLIIVIFIPNDSNANIYQLTCKNKKNTTVWVYSFKRKAVILTKINQGETKVNFTIERNTNTSFMSIGALSKLETNVNYDQSSNQLSVLQASLRGSNQYYQCLKPKLIKEE